MTQEKSTPKYMYVCICVREYRTQLFGKSGMSRGQVHSRFLWVQVQNK